MGDAELPEARVQQILETALGLGINLFDTAPSYGESEARLGRLLKPHRDEVVLSTKLGYAVDGVPDWTGPCITQGIEQALRRLQTDVLDVAHLHSCPREVLARGEVTEALAEAVRAGKVRVAAYSGENEALAHAAADGRFGSLQTSVNVCDQASLRRTIPGATDAGRGIIAKRPLANAFWRFESRPEGQYALVYWDRWEAMGRPVPADELPEVALRFCAYAPGVSSCITGTTNPENLRCNAAAVARGDLDPELRTALMDAFEPYAQSWPGDI